jgi:hypothetical protein
VDIVEPNLSSTRKIIAYKIKKVDIIEPNLSSAGTSNFSARARFDAVARRSTRCMHAQRWALGGDQE